MSLSLFRLPADCLSSLGPKQPENMPLKYESACVRLCVYVSMLMCVHLSDYAHVSLYIYVLTPHPYQKIYSTGL